MQCISFLYVRLGISTVTIWSSYTVVGIKSAKCAQNHYSNSLGLPVCDPSP